MDAPRLVDDDALLVLLGEALAGSRHGDTEALVTGALAAFSFRTMDQELASLVYDSSRERDLVGSERALESARTIVFETDDVSLEIEIREGGMIGQVVPPGRAVVTAEDPEGHRTEVETDDLGCFTLDTPGRGPVRLHIRTIGVTVVTDWTDLGSPP